MMKTDDLPEAVRKGFFKMVLLEKEKKLIKTILDKWRESLLIPEEYKIKIEIVGGKEVNLFSTENERLLKLGEDFLREKPLSDLEEKIAKELIKAVLESKKGKNVDDWIFKVAHYSYSLLRTAEKVLKNTEALRKLIEGPEVYFTDDLLN